MPLTLGRLTIRVLSVCAALILLYLETTIVSTAASATPSGSTPLARSAGCGLQNRKVGTIQQATKDGDNTARSYRVIVPSDYSSARAYPLVFVFHAAGGNSAQGMSWGLQKADGAPGNGIFVFPDGIRFQTFGIGWDSRSTGRDLPFFDNMVKEVEANYCIDTADIFAAGFSWGGDFVITLACNRGDEIRAIAANSSTDEYRDASNYMTYQGLPCPSHHHPAARFEHAQGGDNAYPPPDFATTSRLFQYLNSCSAASTPTKGTAGADSCVIFNGCASGYMECTFDHGVGHALPPKWAENTWDFFQQSSKTEASPD
jgi:poly(3-hydroxybutyrate) depolymerase